MEIQVKVPDVGESVQEAVLAQWYKRDGDFVRKDEILFLIETDKVTLEVSAEADGVLRIKVHEGETVAPGAVVAVIETEAQAAAERPQELRRPEEPARARAPAAEAPPAPSLPEPAGAAPREPGLSPSVQELVSERGVDVSRISGTGPGGRITRGDVLLHLEGEEAAPPPEPRVPQAAATVERPVTSAPGRVPALPPEPSGERTTRKPMSPIRQRIAERLLEARRNTAMLTTFNEIDMSRVHAIRAQFKDAFKAKYGVSLGMMSFFIKASVVALKEVPEVNAFIEGREIVTHHDVHMGVAIGAERGLVVPVIRHADRLSFAEIERAIIDYVNKIRENRLGLSDLEGGTFTISNGGVYGSLLSTPILNTPQSGILGMHKVEERPVVVDGQIVVRPMMYVALSYDHRIIDGREAVTFLKRIKECIEHPERIMMEI